MALTDVNGKRAPYTMLKGMSNGEPPVDDASDSDSLRKIAQSAYGRNDPRLQSSLEMPRDTP